LLSSPWHIGTPFCCPRHGTPLHHPSAMLFLNIAFSSSGKLTTRIPYCKNCINNVPVQVDGQAYVVIHNIMPLSFCLSRRGGTISYSVQRIYASFYLLIRVWHLPSYLHWQGGTIASSSRSKAGTSRQDAVLLLCTLGRPKIR